MINIHIMEAEVLELRDTVKQHYNAHRDAMDRLYTAEQTLALARRT